MELTLEDANTKCEEAIRQNLENIERSDEDVFLRVMEATRKQAGMIMGYLNYPLRTPTLVKISHYYPCKQEELRCISIVDDSLAEAAADHERKCKEQIAIEKKVGLTDRSCLETRRSILDSFWL